MGVHVAMKMITVIMSKMMGTGRILSGGFPIGHNRKSDPQRST